MFLVNLLYRVSKNDLLWHCLFRRGYKYYIMSKGFRLVFPKPKTVEIEEVDVGEPGRGQILVETECTLISTGTEMTAYTGDFPPRSFWAEYVRYPFVPGYSNIGRVVEVGEDVTNIRVGDIVASHMPHITSFVIDAEKVVPVPKNVGCEEAAFSTIASIVLNSVRLSRIGLGESVVIVGLGPLGQLATMFSRFSGGYPVIGVDLSDKRLEIALKSGANRIIKGGEWDKVYGDVRNMTKGRMADVVFEVTGNPKVIPYAIRLCREMGRFIVLSSPRGPSLLDFHDEVNRPSRVIIGTHATSQPSVETLVYPWSRRRNIELFFDLLSERLIDVKHLITHRFNWDEAGEVYKFILENRLETLGVILRFK